MRRYNIYTSVPVAGRYELIKENPNPSGRADEDYWNECFTWEDLKKVIPFIRSQGWRFTIESVAKDEIYGNIHIFSFTYGVNHEFRIINISGLRVIMALDFGSHKSVKESLNPIGY